MSKFVFRKSAVIIIALVVLNILALGCLAIITLGEGWRLIVLPRIAATAQIPQPTSTSTPIIGQAALPTTTATPPQPTAPPPSPTPTNTLVIPPTPTPRTGRVIHIVRPGETLAQIAQLYGVPMPDIMNLNSITNPDHVEVGQQLVIPAPGEVVPTPTPKPRPSTPKPSPTKPPPPTSTPPPPPTQPAWQYSPAGFYTDWNAGLAQIWGTIRDTQGNPVDGVIVQAKCGGTILASNPSGHNSYQPGRCCGYYDIVLNSGWEGIHIAQCRWELRVVDARSPEEGRNPNAVPLSDVAYGEVNVAENATIIVADWIKNW
jgi:LysM repeat protein